MYSCTHVVILSHSSHAVIQYVYFPKKILCFFTDMGAARGGGVIWVDHLI